MRVVDSGGQRTRFGVTMVTLILCVISCRGCSVIAGFQQVVRVRITDADTDAPIANAKIYRIYESEGGVAGQIFVSGADGIADIVEKTFVSCGVALGDPGCDSIVYEDTVTGTMGKYLIDEGDIDDVIELELQEGNFEFGEIYSIEVISISEPLDLDFE
jgi:hypothetical protein